MLLISTLDAAEGEINITMRNLERDVEVGINWTNTWRAKHFICCLLYGFSLFNPVLTGQFWCITPGLLIVSSCLSLDWTTRGISSAQLSVRLFHKAVAVCFSSWLLSSTSSSVSSPLSRCPYSLLLTDPALVLDWKSPFVSFRGELQTVGWMDV